MALSTGHVASQLRQAKGEQKLGLKGSWFIGVEARSEEKRIAN
jgi:hypothetical protein